MNILIIIRPELFSIFIMLFLLVYDRYCAKFRENRNIFFRFALVCLGHCVMAFVTEITVNMDGLNKTVNDICHILFFFFSLLYALFYFEYALSLIIKKDSLKKKFLLAGNIFCVISLIIMIISPIEYVQGNQTNYSAGTGANVCYALGFFLILSADILIITHHKSIKNTILYTIIPLSFITLGFLVVQIFTPEFLYTAQALTLLAVGLFFAIENPVDILKRQAFVDANSQVWNRNCFEYDLEHTIPCHLKNGAKLTYIMGDINGLKAVNDTLSHNDGDRLIKMVADSLHKNILSAYKIYRIGGDEFVVLCFDKSPDSIDEEIAKVMADCDNIKIGDNLPVGISIGYAQLAENETISEAAKRAEYMMYENKKQYYSRSGFDRRIH